MFKENRKPAYAAAYNHPDILPDVFICPQSRIFQCLFAGGYRQLGETVHAADILAGYIVRRVKIFDLSAEADSQI
ncbi:MAG: hypothetical protein EGMGGAKC_00168 [Dehalococcoides mccartyi]|nr:hypothetical protein [Dehalococcoides mccartyi]